jgi:hypothetical protein
MRNEEYMTPVGAGTPEKGRNEILPEVALVVQSNLLERMVPEAVRPYLLDPAIDTERNDPILMELGNRFAVKYLLGFNGFTEYCNQKSVDPSETAVDFMERAKLGQFTEEDYVDMITFFEHSEHGEPFFADEAEVQDFLKPFMH